MSRRARRFVLAGLIVAAAIVAVIVLFVRDDNVEARQDPIRPAKVVRRQPAMFEPGLVPASETNPTHRLEGQVIDEDERPVSGARVQLLWRSPPVTATTDADGSFAFAALQEGRYDLVASTGDLTSRVTRAIVSDDSEPVTLRLSRGCDVRVHVVAAEDSSPIAGALVTGGIDHTGTTGVDGTTELHGLLNDGTWLTAEAAGRAKVQQAVDLALGGGFEEVTLRLPRGAILRGTVIAPDGALVANASVELTAIGRPGVWSERTASTDANGAWSFDALGAGSYEVRASSDLYAEGEPVLVEVDGVHDRSGVVVHVETGAQLVGAVVDSGDRPVARARVDISHESSRWTSTEKTDAGGKFAFIGIPPGAYVVSASGTNSASTYQRVETPDHQRVEIVLHIAESSIAGTVVDPTGEPVAGVELDAYPRDVSSPWHEAISDSAGRFDFGGVPPGSYRITARRPDQTDANDNNGIAVQSGDRNVKIVMHGLTAISGRVLLDHKPVPYFGIVVSDRGEQHWRAKFPVAFRTPTGRFTQRGVAAGDRSIIIVGPGFARRILDVRIPEGKQLELGDIEVDRGQQVSGRVTDASGEPVANATVVVEQRAPIRVGFPPPLLRALGGGAIATTDANGSYFMTGIAAPPDPPMERREFNQISASHPERGSVPPRELGPTESTVDFVLAAAGGIDGVVEGSASTHDHVLAQRGHAADVTFAMIENRHFRFDNLRAGNYTLTIARQNADGFAVPPLPVTVVADKRIPAEFKLPPSVTLAVHVPAGSCGVLRLVTPGTSPPPAEPRSAAGYAYCQGTDAIIEGVVPGSYRACLPSGRCAPVTVDPRPARQIFEFPAK